MVGTKLGGLKAAKTNMERHGKDFYRDIGSKGGRNGHTGGFCGDYERARVCGAKGGATSKRGLKFIKETATYRFYIIPETGEEVKYKK